MSKMLFGSDPEYFAVYHKDGVPYVLSPALMERFCDLKKIGGDIKHPYYYRTNEFSWMMDGVAFELTLLQPHENLVNVWKVIRKSLDELAEFLSKFQHPEYGEISLYTKPVVNIDPNEYLPFLDDDKIYQGFIFGCDPDEDAIDPLYEAETIDVRTHVYRYGGGHEHFSSIPEFRELPRPAIRLLATTVGNFTTAMSTCPELERMRVQTYGRPGRFRPQKYKGGVYGVEYRTPSNSWTSFPQGQIEEMERLAYKAVEYLQDERKGMEVLNTFLPDTINAIVNCDQTLAGSILSALP